MTENPSGVTGAITELGSHAIKSLAGPMLALVLLNIVFFGAGFLFLHNQQADRNAFFNKILDVCITAGQATQQLRDEVIRK